MGQGGRSRLYSLVVIAVGASNIIISSPILAGNPPTSGQIQRLPHTVTLKTDMVFHVPFSVTGDTVPVQAGTEVSLKGVRDKYLKLAYGPAELTVDPAQTDFAERMRELPQLPVSQLASIAQITPKRFLAATDSAALARSSGNAEQRGMPWLFVLIFVILFVAVGLSIFKDAIRRHFGSVLQKRRWELAHSGQPSTKEIEDALSDLDWFQFEKLMSALFKAQGHAVEMRGGANADGGIDLVVVVGSEKKAVQCKHWGSWKCAPKVVRELLGAMTHEGFAQGILVCRRATPAAHDLAQQERITVIERDGVVQLIRNLLGAEGGAVRCLLFAPDKMCPKCGAQMVLRTATKGSNVGAEFWGCSKYPDCRQTMRV